MDADNAEKSSVMMLIKEENEENKDKNWGIIDIIMYVGIICIYSLTPVEQIGTSDHPKL